MSRYVKGNSLMAPPENEPVLPLSGRMNRNRSLPRHTPEPFPPFPEQRLSLRFSIGAEARLLLVIAVVCGLLIHEGRKRSAVASPQLHEQLHPETAPQAAQPAPFLSKPTPIVPVAATITRSERATVSKQLPHSDVHAASVAPHESPMRYEATRKKVFGGCTGELELNGSRLVFRCPNQADLVLPVAAIAKAHKDGIVLKSGEKYHFRIANQTPGQAEAIFISWLKSVQQAGGVSSF
jgi:hypothetical protein